MKRTEIEQTTSETDVSHGADVTGKTESRRRFVKTASTASLVTTLAAGSAWGVGSASGTTSGGSTV